MNLNEVCLDCLYRQIERLAKDNKVSRANQELAIREFNEFLTTIDFNDYTPPEVASYFYKILQNLEGVDDLYFEEKVESTKFALKLYEEFKEILADDKRTFADMIKVIISANIIDYGAYKNLTIPIIKEHILKSTELPLDSQKIDILYEQMHKAKSIFYIADNCGEIVFDQFLIDKFKDKITLGIRGKATLNDVTPKDIELSKIDHPRIIHTNDNTPGVSLRKSSEEFLYHLYNSDFIIAKGQGNYESLHMIERPICHLLCIKCEVISQLVGTPVSNLYIELRNIIE